MATAKTGHKSNKEGLMVWKLFDANGVGKLITPCLYNGSAAGHGKYYASYVDGALVLDEAGKPYPYGWIGNKVPAVEPKKA